jgi:hypothetical protein
MTAIRHAAPDPPPEVIKADPATCPHAVLDEGMGREWGFEDCVTCGKRFPMRDEQEAEK